VLGDDLAEEEVMVAHFLDGDDAALDADGAFGDERGADPVRRDGMPGLRLREGRRSLQEGDPGQGPEPESGFEAEAATGATAASEEDSCCELFRKLNIGLFEAYSCLEQTHAVEGLGEEAGAATEVATGEALNTEAAVGTEADDKCQCRDNSEKLWCEEFLKLGMGRRCTELRKLLENRNSGVNIGTVNHFKIIWQKDGVL